MMYDITNIVLKIHGDFSLDGCVRPELENIFTLLQFSGVLNSLFWDTTPKQENPV